MFHRVDASGLRLFVYLIPKSSIDKVVGVKYGDDGKKCLVVRLRAAPENGRANTQLIRFLSKQWRIPLSCISLKSGVTSRHKQLHFSEYIEELEKILHSLEDCASAQKNR
ncbi:DUF167 domain-containing protein [Bartonella sp. CB178]|uniref:DUF167 domain-containing protein n=1 Tax=Bartonella sp. CB178 TaxID=3112255 RepID=UPI00300DCE2A